MANWSPELVTPTLVAAPTAISGQGPTRGSGLLGAAGGTTVEANHGVIGLVLIAAVAIFLLDKAGFRFAVTTGKR